MDISVVSVADSTLDLLCPEIITVSSDPAGLQHVLQQRPYEVISSCSTLEARATQETDIPAPKWNNMAISASNIVLKSLFSSSLDNDSSEHTAPCLPAEQSPMHKHQLLSLPTKLFVDDSDTLAFESLKIIHIQPVHPLERDGGDSLLNSKHGSTPSVLNPSPIPSLPPSLPPIVDTTNPRPCDETPSKGILDYDAWFSSEGNSSSILLQTPMPKKSFNLHHTSPHISHLSVPQATLASREQLSALLLTVTAPETSALLLAGTAPETSTPRIGYLRRPMMVSDPIESGSSSPFKEPAPKKRKQAKVKPLAPTLPESDIIYDLKAINDANKATRSKEELFGEMVVHVPPSLETAPYLKQKFAQLGIKPTNDPRNTNVIFWSRSISSRYDAELDLFIPCSVQTVVERNFAVYLTAESLLKCIDLDGVEDLISRAKLAIRYDPSHASESISAETGLETDAGHSKLFEPSVILIVEGYDKHISKLKAAQDRIYKQQVRQDIESQSRIGVSRATGPDVNIPLIEKKINRLQIVHNVNVFFTKNQEDTIDWLYSFTGTISSNRYVNPGNREVKAVSKTKSGTDSHSTFLQSLQQFKYITGIKAERVAHYYSGLSKIYDTYQLKEGLGKALDGTTNIVPPSTDLAMRTFFVSTDPDEVLE